MTKKEQILTKVEAAAKTFALSTITQPVSYNFNWGYLEATREMARIFGIDPYDINRAEDKGAHEGIIAKDKMARDQKLNSK